MVSCSLGGCDGTADSQGMSRFGAVDQVTQLIWFPSARESESNSFRKDFDCPKRHLGVLFEVGPSKKGWCSFKPTTDTLKEAHPLVPERSTVSVVPPGRCMARLSSCGSSSLDGKAWVFDSPSEVVSNL